MTDKEQMLLEALNLARKHLPLSFVDLPDGHFCDVRTLIDEAIEAAEPEAFYVEENKTTYQMSGDSNRVAQLQKELDDNDVRHFDEVAGLQAEIALLKQQLRNKEVS